MSNQPPIEQRCRLTLDALELCAEPVARYVAADRSEAAGYPESAGRLRDRTATMICTHLEEQAMRESRR